VISEKQLAANRRNAQKSTGPQTPEGRAIASHNSTTHGLTSKAIVIEGENLSELKNFRLKMFDELNPVGPMETMLSERIITLAWRLFRADRCQSAAINTLTDRAKSDKSNLLANLLNPIKARQSLSLSSNRDQSPDDSQSENENLLGDVTVKDFSNTRVLERLLMYERRIESSLYKTHLELQRLQLLRLRKQAIEQELQNDPI